MMGKCFKLFGKSIKNQKPVDSKGSAFFVSEHYLLTCKHLVSALSKGDNLNFSLGDNIYSAELVEVAEKWDLALLYTETDAEDEWIFFLDRVAVEGSKAIAHGYPYGQGLDVQRDLTIGTEVDEGVAILTNASGTTVGFSGGPVSPESNPGTAVGIFISIKGQDEYGRRTGTSSFVLARVALELWGEQYGLQETRYTEKPDAFGDNSFVYSARKTAYQDPYGYIRMLQNFLEDSQPVLWQAVVGPGGSGKSRLCYELASSLNSNWRCKLLGARDLKRDRIQALYEAAGRSFLLLADYAYADTGELGEWLDERAREKNKPKIRVILLQRETGREGYGWQESLLRCNGNLIRLRYKEDLQLKAPGQEETIALMRSYADTVGGKDIDAEELYTVLQNIDPDLTRPLFAMFIVDADLHGDDPRKWDLEEALAHFSRREKDIIDRALKDEKDARVAKLILVIATITEGFILDEKLLGSTTLCELREFSELQDRISFGSRMYGARLADWEHGRYAVRPLKPDLLGEYYVLMSFREMMKDPHRKDGISTLINIAREAELEGTINFLMRAFTDYETDEDLVRVCCGEDPLLQSGISMGLAMRPDEVLLRKLYRVYKTDLWLEQYVKGLVKALKNQTDEKKVAGLLDELRSLRLEKPGKAEISTALALGLSKALYDQTDVEKAGVLLDELRTLHIEEPRNVKISTALSRGLLIGLLDQTDKKKADGLLKELHTLYMKESGNVEISISFIRGAVHLFQ